MLQERLLSSLAFLHSSLVFVPTMLWLLVTRWFTQLTCLHSSPCMTLPRAGLCHMVSTSTMAKSALTYSCNARHSGKVFGITAACRQCPSTALWQFGSEGVRIASLPPPVKVHGYNGSKGARVAWQPIGDWIGVSS